MPGDFFLKQKNPFSLRSAGSGSGSRRASFRSLFLGKKCLEAFFLRKKTFFPSARLGLALDVA